MLCYDIRELEREAVRVEGDLPASDPVWMNDDVLPDQAVHATGRLSKAGAGRFYWSGHIEGTATVPCRRCLADASARVSEDVHLLFVETGDEVADDPDTFRLEPRAREIDLRPAVREQWLLAVPGFAVCRGVQGTVPAMRQRSQCGAVRLSSRDR